jgi:hypothetical protein
MEPSIGRELYIPSSSSFEKSEPAILGGLATIGEVLHCYGDPFVSLKELPGYSFNFSVLLEQQGELKKTFGRKRAHLSTHQETIFGTIKRVYKRMIK